MGYAKVYDNLSLMMYHRFPIAQLEAPIAKQSPMIKLLEQNPWLLSLPEIARHDLLSVATFKQVAAGYVLFRKGDSCADLYGLLSGRIKIGATTYSGPQSRYRATDSNKSTYSGCTNRPSLSPLPTSIFRNRRVFNTNS